MTKSLKARLVPFCVMILHIRGSISKVNANAAPNNEGNKIKVITNDLIILFSFMNLCNSLLRMLFALDSLIPHLSHGYFIGGRVEIFIKKPLLKNEFFSQPKKQIAS